MIDLYYWTTPNGHKILIFLEEAGVPHHIHPVNISKGEQFEPDFLRVAPNHRIPAIVDMAPADGGSPISVFESGAILQYLGEKTGQFLPADVRGRTEVMQRLHWQIGGLGPMAGQNHHIVQYATEPMAYAVDRYVNETSQLCGVLNKRLSDRDYITGDYSIADTAAYRWLVPHKRQQQNLSEFPQIKRWFGAMRARFAVKRAYEPAREINRRPVVSEKSRAVLFGQTASCTR